MYLQPREARQLIDLISNPNNLPDSELVWYYLDDLDTPYLRQRPKTADFRGYTRHNFLPAYTFQELLELLPKRITIVPKVSSMYLGTRDKVGPKGESLYHHYLNFGIDSEGFWIGYKYSYFDTHTPMYPWPELDPNEDEWEYVLKTGGLTGQDWIKVTYDLLIKLLNDNLYYAGISSGNNN